MEQRALLAVALAGCVTAAGAGGYVAIRQHARTPAATVPTASSESSDGAVEATEGEIAPGPSADTPAVAAAPGSAAPAAVPLTTPRPVSQAPVVRASRPAATVGRPSTTPVRPAPAATSPAAPTREATSPASSWPSAPEPVDVGTPPREASGRDATWPSPEPDTAGGRANSDTWPRRDGEVAGSSPARSTDDTTSANLPVRRTEAVTIPADAVIGVQLESTVSSHTAKVEDPVRARVTRDVYANGEVVVPAGSRLQGSVVLVEEGGKIRERARLGVRFHSLVLADGTEVRLPTETIYRDGESPAGRSAAKIGGATVGGAILGAILGGGRGAVIGAATGAGSGTAVAMAGERRPAELRSGQPVTVRVSSPVTTQVER